MGGTLITFYFRTFICRERTEEKTNGKTPHKWESEDGKRE